MLEKMFALSQRGTNLRTELIAGFTTFMTMAYILFVNPLILSGIPELHDKIPALVAATALAAAVPCLLMGFWANVPVALAPGMGLNAAVLALCSAGKLPFSTAMGVVFIEGSLILLVALTPAREAIVRAIPAPLKHAISAGIGFFIAMLGLVGAGIVKMNMPTAPLTFGSFHEKSVLVATLGILITLALFVWRVRAALLLGILITTLLAIGLGVSHAPQTLLQAPQWDTFGKMNIPAALQPALWGTILAFLMSDFFDTVGTVLGVCQQAGLNDAQGVPPNMRRILIVDSFAALWGGVCGSSSCTSYIESATGVGEGGRTGLATVTTGALFVAAFFVAPLATAVPAQATAAALLVVGFLMMGAIKHISFDKPEEGIPAFLTLIAIPLTYSIAHGIGLGFLSYIALMLVRGRSREVSPLLYVAGALFALTFAMG